jgi:hypothetical protein
MLQSLSPALASAASGVNISSIKGTLAGSATSTNGQGIAMSLTFQTPKVTTSSSTTYFFGFNGETAASIATIALHSAAANQCMLVASTTEANWKLQCDKATVITIADTGVSTTTSATTPQRATLVLDQSGAAVYFNGANTAAASIAFANVPVVNLRPVIGVGASVPIQTGSSDFYVGDINVWSAY